uniref:Uncharacterized protein n=1 Tax=Glossina brevipalpis TaxID=37001 RepID=A0A1A9WUF5_9MUSC
MAFDINYKKTLINFYFRFIIFIVIGGYTGGAGSKGLLKHGMLTVWSCGVQKYFFHVLQTNTCHDYVGHCFIIHSALILEQLKYGTFTNLYLKSVRLKERFFSITYQPSDSSFHKDEAKHTLVKAQAQIMYKHNR